MSDRAVTCVKSLLAGWMCLAGSAGWAAAATSTQPAGGDRDLAVAGSESTLWVVVGEQKDDARLNWLAWMEKTSLAIRPLRIPAQLGRLQRWAAFGDSLHLFLILEGRGEARTAHYSYARTSEPRRDRRLPGDAIPMALSGHEGTLWAVVDAPTATAVEAAWAEARRPGQTQPADEAGESPAIASRPAESAWSCFLVKYDGIDWQPSFEGPPMAQSPARIWLVAAGERFHLIWQQRAEDRELRHAVREAGAWENGAVLTFRAAPTEGFAGVLNKQLVFAATVPREAGEGLSCETRVWMSAPSEPGRWADRPALQTEQGAELILPAGAAIGGFADKLAVAGRMPSGPQLGLWSPAGGAPVLAFKEVPVQKAPATSPESTRFRDLVSMLVVVGILLLVYWRRQESDASPLVMPAGLAAADLGRRGLAALIDFAPAAVVVGLLWRAPLAAYIAEFHEAASAPEPVPIPVPVNLTWGWILLSALYAAYCMAFELMGGRTPGKRLLGCSVVAESLEPPTRMQIVVRNLARLLELEPHLHLWPFVLIIFLTRNRQRVGDLLARTLVVEHRRIETQDEPPVRPRGDGEVGGG